ncbi:PilZ domain-containing protein [Sphingomonas sp. S2-65]|uniref:PilZ domain-containing protein n=1 Tax=Sphingomonas sp. S2-65 TaxID=2903960 RepID=UPI001F2CE1AA|nr:PilZ domain-containing protein [Sphingomonas sp. S2-65]UYY57052.1 PilZ domain-containing protein [Sphingomonas sp. S2-65]
MMGLFKSTPGAASQTGERRVGGRRMLEEASTLRGPDRQPVDVTVSDLSQSGFNVRSDRELPLGAVVHLGLPGRGSLAARVVRRAGDHYGCEFLQYLADEQVAAAFEQSNVTTLFLGSSEWETAEPVLRRWPRPVRAAVALVGALLAWGAILWLIQG